MIASPPVNPAGSLRLRFGRSGTRTVATEIAGRLPLRAGRILEPAPGWAEVYLLNPSGGLLGGDTIDLDVTLDPGARVRLRTPEATKVYRSGGRPTRQSARFTVGPAAGLVYLPEPLIPYGGAWLEQTTRVDLDPAGWAILGEVIGPGRWSRGEVFAYEHLGLHLEVWRAGRRVVLDRLRFEPHRWTGGSRGRLGRATHFARLFCLGADVALADRLAGLPDDPALPIGWSRLPNDAGLFLTALGHDAASLQAALDRKSVV